MNEVNIGGGVLITKQKNGAVLLYKKEPPYISLYLNSVMWKNLLVIMEEKDEHS